MSWPLSQDYNEVIQDAANSFGDAELKTGEAVTNPLGIPLPRSGNFADVYEVRCPSGSRWAVKCFTREVAGLRERYNEISKFLHKANLPFMVDFQYQEQGIRVRGQWYPILKMQWVEGFVLNEFVRDNLDKKPILQAMGQIWLRMARRLREAKLAHCDLQHGNVLLVPGSTANSLAVKLIDYDGMCVPALAGTKSGEVGHPAFQHPERLRTGAYNQEVDRFSLLAIATGLRCLTVGGRSLWERYDNGDNLLFRQADLQAPDESPLFKELLEIPDAQAQSLVKELFRACRGPLKKVPLLTDLMPEEKPVAKTAAVGTLTKQSAAAQGAEWDFNEEESGNAVVKKRRASGKMPTWVWGAIAGAAALLLLGVGVGAGLMMRNGPAEKEETPVAKKTKPEAKIHNPTPKPPVSQPVNPLANTIDPPNPPAIINPPVDIASPTRIFQLTPAGDMLAISSPGDKTWRLVDPRTQKPIHEFIGHEGPITAVTFSPSGDRAVTGGQDKTIRLWDVKTQRLLRTIKTRGGPIVSLALSPDGKRVACADTQSSSHVWDLDTGSGHSYSSQKCKVVAVAFAADGRYYLTGLNKLDENVPGPIMFLWPLVAGVRVRSLHGRFAPITCVAISPDGKYVAAGHASAKDGVSLWDAATGKLISQHDMPSTPTHQVNFSSDSRILVSASGHSVRMWKVEGGQGIAVFDPASEDLACGGISSDGTEMLCASCKGDFVRLLKMPLSADLIVKPMPERLAQQNLGWGKPVDPDGDCKFKNVAGKLTIDVPGTGHSLNVDRGLMNAPRVLRDIEGDFIAQVRVSGDFQSSPKSTINGLPSYVGAGLVLWVDERTCIRLEGAALRQFRYANWELRQNGKKIEVPHGFQRLAGPETYLRLERRGGKVLGSHSDDGQKWTELKPIDIELPAKVKIGVLANSSSALPFAPSFDQFQLKKGQGEMVGVNLPLSDAAAPVVVNPPLVWDKPVDPDGDCKFKNVGGKLTLTVPDKPHVLETATNRANSPRALFDIEGDFTAQVRVSGDFTLGKPSWIGAGLLLWVDENTFLRLERADLHGRNPSLYANLEVRQDGKERRVKHNFPGLDGAETYLRLERRGNRILAAFSSDGQQWNNVEPFDIELPAKVKLGVLAGSTSANPFAPVFDQFQLKKGQGEMVGVNLPLSDAAVPVVVNPPPPKPRRRRAPKQPVPDAVAVEAAVKVLRTRYKDEYKGDRNQLRTALYNELNAGRNDPVRHFAVLRELRDTEAETNVYGGMSQAQQMAQAFDVNREEMKCIALEMSLRSARPQSAQIVELGLPLLDQAVSEENYDVVARLVKAVRISAGKLPGTDTKRQMAERVLRQAENASQEHKKLQPDRVALEADPVDPKANLAVGKFHCVTRGDWEEGLPLLALGSDTALKALAQKDLANPDDATAQAALGDDWRKEAGRANAKSLKTACQKRADYWYQQAALQLKGTKLKTVQKSRMALAKTTPELQNPWWPFGIYCRYTLDPANGSLRIQPSNGFQTRQYYRGPIDITVVARSMPTDLNITIGAGGRLVIGQSFNKKGDHLQVFRPDGVPESIGSRAIEKAVTLPASRWFTIRWQVTASGMKVLLDGETLFEETRDYDLSSKYPVRIHCNSAAIEIKSVVVKRGPTK